MPEDITFTGKIIRETDMAILFREIDWLPDGSDDTWLPKSQIAVIHREGDKVEVELPEWLAVKKEIF